MLEPLGQTSVDVPELSGLSLHPQRGTLWAVGDDAGRAFEIDIAQSPRVTGSVALQGAKRADLEGIAIAPDGESMWVAAEKKCRLLQYTMDGTLLQTVHLPRGSKKNAGIEGLCVDPAGPRYFAVRERKPKRIVELDATFVVMAEVDVDAFEDLSGICLHDGALWIISDASAALAKLVPTEDGWAWVGRWELPRRRAEGIAWVGSRLFIGFDDEPGADNLAWFAPPTA